MCTNKRRTKDKDALWIGIVGIQVSVQVIGVDGNRTGNGVRSLR